MQIKSFFFCLKSSFLCIDVTVYRMRILSVDKQDDAVVEWLRL